MLANADRLMVLPLTIYTAIALNSSSMKSMHLWYVAKLLVWQTILYFLEQNGIFIPHVIIYH